MRNKVNLDIPDSEWEPNAAFSDPYVGLTGPTVILNGSGGRLHMHMEAWQVTYDDDGQVIPAETWSEEYGDLHAAVHADGCFETLRLFGRDYVVVISPYCD